MLYFQLYCNGFDQSVATQRFRKHSPTRNSRWGCVFYVVPNTPSAGNGPINWLSDMWHVFYVWSAPCNNREVVFSVRGPCRVDVRKFGNGNWLDNFNVISGGKRCSKGTSIIKKVQPLPFYQRRNNERRGKNKSLDIEQIYDHGFQRGSMPGVTVLDGCRQ
jgi:hypothetical protein